MDTVMQWLGEWIGPLSVTGRALLGVGTGAVCLGIAVALTSFLTGLRIAMALWTTAVAAAALAIIFVPVASQDFPKDARPTDSVEAAMARFEQDLAVAPQPLNPLCAPYVRSDGARSDTVVVLIHGVSSCPQAFVDFTPHLRERGITVMAVRMPQNGYADRATDALKDLTAEGLAAFGDDVVDVATGLGEEVIVLGISAGGTVAGWVAQQRSEVDRAVLVAPFYGLGRFGPRMNRALMRAMLFLPDISIWKDPIARDRAEGGMAHAYKRQSTHGTGEIMRLGLATAEAAGRRPPAAGDIVVVTNDADTAVSNETTAAVVDAWRARGADLTTATFPARHGLGHELIDPEEPGANTALTYPVLLELITDPAGFDPESVNARLSNPG